MRTEAQMRASLHAHILCWFKKRRMSDDFKPIPVIERTAPGVEPRQRPLGQTVAPLQEHQEDNIYQHAHVGPVTAEMVRPNVSGSDWGGYNVEIKDRRLGQNNSTTTAAPPALQQLVLLEESFHVPLFLSMALSAAPMLRLQHRTGGFTEVAA